MPNTQSFSPTQAQTEIINLRQQITNMLPLGAIFVFRQNGVGFIFITHAKNLNEPGNKNITLAKKDPEKIIKKIKKYLNKEVKFE